jgi:hypothetical protein
MTQGRVSTRGPTEEAIALHTRLIELWAECDPDLVPVREEVGSRRNALARGRN